MNIKVTVEEKVQQAKPEEADAQQSQSGRHDPQSEPQAPESGTETPEGWDQYDPYSEGEQQTPDGWQQMPQQGQGFGGFDPFSFFFGY